MSDIWLFINFIVIDSVTAFMKADYHTCVTQVVNVGRDPASVGQLLQVVGGLVISADENGQNCRDFFAGVILWKETQTFRIQHVLS